MTVGIVPEPAAPDLERRVFGPERKLGPTRAAQQHQSDFARKVTARWRSGDETMMGARRQYWQNLAFYLGRQWVWWSNVRNLLQPYVREQYPLGKGRVRLTFNRFGPNILNVYNRLLRSELAFEVPPSDGGDATVEGAKRAEKVIDAKRRDDNWESVRGDEVLACLLGGISAVALEWDSTAGPQLEWDERYNQPVGTGDVYLRPLTVAEFCVEPAVRHYSDARWWIMGLALPIDYVAEKFSLDWLPFPDAGSQTPLYDTLLEGAGRSASKNLCLVLTYYERPGPNSKGGFGVVVNGCTLEKRESWPFEFPELNLTCFRQKVIPSSWLGATFASDAIAIQSAYNFSRSCLQEHLKLAGQAKLLAPFGSIDEEDIHGSAGDLVYFTADGTGTAPYYLSPPNLPRWMSAEAETLAAELDNVMHVHDISRGIGFSRASGQALSFLAEQDDSPIGHMVTEQKLGWERLGTQVLKMLGKRATETRTSAVDVGQGVTESLKWRGEMLQGQYRVTVPREAVAPRNAAARMANAKDLWDRKIITDARVYARQAGLPAEMFGQLMSPDEEAANRENLRMSIGQVVLPEKFEDHAAHIAEHNDRLRKTDAYRYAPEEIRSIIDDHISYHEKMAANEFARQKALGQMNPAAPGVPQADAPEGSAVPASGQEAQRQLGVLAQLGGGGGSAALPPGPSAAAG